jgi:hypothetical protein
MDIADMGFVQLIAVVILGMATGGIAQWIEDDRRAPTKAIKRR